jgi:hypothetical protein
MEGAGLFLAAADANKMANKTAKISKARCLPRIRRKAGVTPNCSKFTINYV